MGIVTNYLRDTIQKQVDEHGLVVWYDPEKHYAEVAPNLNISNTHFFAYSDSFFRLRHDIEPHFNGQMPPRMVVYLQIDPAQTFHALAELEVAGVVVKPGQQPVTRNTRLSVIARNALKQAMSAENIAALEKRIDAGKLTLAELDRLADSGESISREALTLIFGTNATAEIVLLFLSNTKFDKPLVTKDALSQIVSLVSDEFGLTTDNISSPETLRTALGRHLLSTEFLLTLRGNLPPEFKTVPLPNEARQREACVSLVQTWRKRSDLSVSYADQAAEVERGLRLGSVELRLEAILAVETFLEVEQNLQQAVETALIDNAVANLIQLAEARQSSFWSQHEPRIQPRWALIGQAAQLLAEADRIETALKSPLKTANDLIQAYTVNDLPWYMMDTIHRQMEKRYHNFEISEQHQQLEKLVAKARGRYMEVAATLAGRFVHAYEKSRFTVPNTLKQTQIFEQKVRPYLSENKVAYVWVDALRYEMAIDLVKGLSEDFEIDMQPALATPPTITPIGMAALLPESETAKLVNINGKLALQIGDTVIKDRSDRVKFLKSVVPDLYDTQLGDLIPKPSSKVEKGIRSANLILVTSQEIDESGETDRQSARRNMDEVLYDLQRALRMLVKYGVETIILTADHGHLFIESTASDMKIGAPGGDTINLHRRAWVGRGGAANPAYLRANLSEFGVGSDLELAVPYNFAVFVAQGGANSYFHGGLSPQELIIPVVTLMSKRKTTKLRDEIIWELIPGSQKISRFFSVQVKGRSDRNWPVTPAIRLEIRIGNQVVSTPVSASYGFEESTGNVQLKLDETNPQAIDPNSVTLMINGEDLQNYGDIILVDAVSGVKLASLDKLEFAIFM